MEISLGDLHSCALDSHGSVVCWGDNRVGQLGTGSIVGPDDCSDPNLVHPACAKTPVAVSSLTGVSYITAGNAHTCALLVDGTVKCWGANNYGQLGIGTTTGPATCYMGEACSPTPVSVPNLAGVIAISAGASHTCAVLSDGSVRCWGWNIYGQLGDGTTQDSATPVAVNW
jgi:alpha-tubulin suppressor-like RCC1 family protein